jgi:hypothetical protein
LAAGDMLLHSHPEINMKVASVRACRGCTAACHIMFKHVHYHPDYNQPTLTIL